jgi:hypothetical protein
MKDVVQMTNEQRIALIKLAVISAVGQASTSIEFSTEQDELLCSILDEQSQILKGAKLTNGDAEGIVNAVKDLLAFIDKLPKE